MDRGARWATVHVVTKSLKYYSATKKNEIISFATKWIQLETVIAEKATATQSSTLAWKISWTEEPGRLQSMGSLRLSDFTFTFHYHALEKEMATHSSVLPWRIQWTEEPGGLQSMGSQRTDYDFVTEKQQNLHYIQNIILLHRK